MNNILVTAKQLEELGILKRRTAFKMTAAGMLPHYRVGTAGAAGVGGGIRYKVQEVLDALRVPAKTAAKK